MTQPGSSRAGIQTKVFSRFPALSRRPPPLGFGSTWPYRGELHRSHQSACFCLHIMFPQTPLQLALPPIQVSSESAFHAAQSPRSLVWSQPAILGSWLVHHFYSHSPAFGQTPATEQIRAHTMTLSSLPIQILPSQDPTQICTFTAIS